MAQRSVWKGTLGFGMVNIPVKLYNATEDKSKALRSNIHQLHAECGTQIKMPKYCPHCDRQLQSEELVKGYQIADEQFIHLTEQDLQSLPLNSLKSIVVEKFVSEDDEWLSDPRWYKNAYYISPDTGGSKAFVLFLKAMEALEVAGLAKVTMREHEHLVLISPYNGLLMMETLHWADELRPYEDLVSKAEVSENELDMAQKLIQAMTGSVDPSDFSDAYYQALVELINAKQEGRVLTPAAEAPKIGDMVDQLMASIEAENAKAEAAKAA